LNTLNLEALNDKQKEAVLKTEGAVLVTAGAGSGKTRVLTYRIAKLIQEGIAPYNILAVTFTNKASAEMKERVNSLIESNNANDVWIFTFHSMCVKLLREHKNIERFNGYSTSFSIYDTTDRERVLKNIIAKNNILEEGFLEKVNWHLSNCKNKNLSLNEYKQEILYLPNNEQIIEVMSSYENEMNLANALDFDSLLTYTYKLLVNNPDILSYYQDKFKYIHVDEFQDTNKVQYDLIKLLSGKHKNVFVVGDEDQCIYTWRGANSSHIFAFSNDFAPVTLIKLEQNYRSTKKIIELANQVIKNNTSRLEKTLWTEKDEGVKVEYSSQYNQNYEANYVAECIFNLVRMSGYNYSDVAVLMRLNALTRNLENKFLEFNIPYQVYGGMKFYDRVEIKNILAYLRLLVNPKDNASFNRIINFPKRGIGESALLQLNQINSVNSSLYETVMNLSKESMLSGAVLNKFLSFQALMKNLSEKINTVPIKEFVEYALEMSGINELYGSGSEEDISRLYNLSEFINSIDEYEKNNENVTLEEYLQSVTLTSDIDNYDEDKNLVTLATVHSVKGLEFKVVFIIGAEEGIFPIKRKDSSEEDMEEERRLMYVAITRARERLYFTSSKERLMYGNIQLMLPSRFLKEAKLIEDKKDISFSNYNSYVRQDIITLSEIKEVKTIKTSVNELVSKLKVSDKVSHPKFGIGIVTNLSGTNETKTATVHFEGVGTRILALNFAPLTIVK